MRLTRSFFVAIPTVLIAVAAWPAISTVTVPMFSVSATFDGERIDTEIGSVSTLAALRECTTSWLAAGSLTAQELPPPGNPVLAGCIAGCVYSGEAAEENGVDGATIWEIVRDCKERCRAAHGTD